MSKLTPKQRNDIRRKAKSGKFTYTQLAIEYKTCTGTIKGIVKRSNLIDRE